MAAAAPQEGLGFIEIPGYAEEVRRERDLRREGFSNLDDDYIGGIPVKAFTPRHLLWLEALHNGFVCPFRFDSVRELAGQIGQFLWIVSRDYAPPRGWWHRQALRFHRRSLMVVLRRRPAELLVAGIIRYLDEAFYDAPVPPPDAPAPQANTLPWAGLLYDEMTGLGYRMKYEEFLDLPFRRLWQLFAMGWHRQHPEMPLTSPSDAFAARYIEELNRRRAAAGPQPLPPSVP